MSRLSYRHTASAKRRVRGAGLVSVLLGLIGLVAVITLALKLGPHYIDWRTMQSVFDGLKEQRVEEMSKTAIYETLAKRFRINGLRDFDLRNIVEVDEAKEGTTVTVSYERREHIAMNLDVVLSFSESYKYP